MFEKVKELLAKQLKKDPSVITMDATIIPDEKLAKFSTVGDIVRYLDSL